MNRRAYRILILSAAVLAAALLWVAAGRGKAPRFTLTTDQGNTISPSKFGGKLLVLNFWASWCAPCAEEIPTLDNFQRRFAQQGVVVLGVSVDREEQPYREFLNRVHVSYQTGRDPLAERGLAARFGTVQFPETYVIDSAGRVVIKIGGPQNFMDPDFGADIQTLLSGKKLN